LVCSPGNYFLARALNTIEEVDTVIVAPDQAAPEGTWDLAIYDRGLPENPPDVPALFIGLAPWASGRGEAPGDEASGSSAVGSITHWDSEHPVARNVQWSTVQVFEFQSVAPPPGTRALVESGDVPLLLVGRSGGQVVLHLTFDLFDSNFPLRSAFPIFMRNTVNWLTRDRAARESESWNGGKTLTFAVPHGVGEIKLLSPDHHVWELAPGPDGLISFAETYASGVWRAEISGQPTQRFAVNLLDRSESKPDVVAPVRMDAEGIETAEGLGTELRANREIWRWLAAAALLVLLAEWYLYRRPLTA
jgi:hypothetical protein